MKLLKVCNFFIKTCLFLVIALSPIFFQCVSYRCWELNQLALLQVLVGIAALFWLIKAVVKGIDLKHLSFKVIGPIILFLASLIIATLFSASPQFSFLGAYGRKMGLITWLHLFIFLIIFITEIKSIRQIKHLLIVILAATTLVCVYGFCQNLGIDFMNWGSDTPLFSHRIFSSFGQPNFFASWLLMVLPICVFSLVYFKGLNQKIFIGFLTLAVFGCLILTMSRGGWIGFLLEIILLVAWVLALKQRKKCLMVLGILLLILAVGYVGLNLFFNSPSSVNKSPLLDRLESLLFLKKSTTAYTRLIGWQIALDLIKQKPILGYGPEMFYYYTARYYQPQDAIFEAINSFPDRAHNDILDMLLVAGLVGLVTYFWLLYTIFKTGLTLVKKKFNQGFSNYGLPMMLLAGLFGYLISLQFSFHVIQTSIYFFLYFGLIIILARLDELDPKEEGPKPVRMNFVKILFIIFLAFSTFLLFGQFSFKMILADVYYKKAFIAIHQQDIAKSLNYYQKIFNLEPEENFYRSTFSRDLLGIIDSIPDQNSSDKLKMINLASQAIDDIPLATRGMWDKASQAKLYALKARVTQQNQDFEKANQIIAELISTSPRLACLYYDWCQLKFDEKQWDQALSKCQTALGLYPDLKHPQLNEMHRQQIVNEMIGVYGKMGQIYFIKQDYLKARQMYKTLLHLSPFQYDVYKKLADTYYMVGDLDSAIKYNLHGFTLSPHDSAWPFSVALLYIEKGNLKLAQQYGQQALNLSPDNQVIKLFLEKIK